MEYNKLIRRIIKRKWQNITAEKSRKTVKKSIVGPLVGHWTEKSENSRKSVTPPNLIRDNLKS